MIFFRGNMFEVLVSGLSRQQQELAYYALRNACLAQVRNWPSLLPACELFTADFNFGHI